MQTTCPPCNANCNQGRTCPTKLQQSSAPDTPEQSGWAVHIAIASAIGACVFIISMIGLALARMIFQ